MTEILRLLPRALFQYDNAETVLRKFARQHATRCAAAHDDEVHCFVQRIAF